MINLLSSLNNFMGNGTTTYTYDMIGLSFAETTLQLYQVSIRLVSMHKLITCVKLQIV